MVKTLAKIFIRYRIIVILFVSFLTIFLLIQTHKLEVNNDMDTWLPQKDKVTKLFKETGKIFASNSVVFVILDLGDVFTEHSLCKIEKLTKALEEVEELYNVTSLTNAIDIRKVEDGIEVRDLIDEIPHIPQRLKELKEYIMSKELYKNVLISEDARYTIVIANIKDEADEIKTSQKIINVTEKLNLKEKVYIGGDPANNFYTDKYMNEEFKTRIPFIILIMCLILFLGFRKLSGILLPLLLAGISVVWLFGIEGLFDGTINMLTVAVVILLIVMASDYTVHFLNHYFRKGEPISSVMEISSPIFMSAITTMAGLFTFAFTRISVLQNFGISIAIGLGIAMSLTIVFLPSILSFGNFKAQKIIKKKDIIIPFLSKIQEITSKNYKKFFVFLLVIALFSVIGIFKIYTSTNMADTLPKNSSPRKAMKILQQRFGGSYPVILYFKGDFRSPMLLRVIQKAENFMRSIPLLGAHLSVVDFLAEENWLLNGYFSIPETKAQADNLYFFLEGQESLKRIITENKEQGIINTYIKDTETKINTNTANQIDEFIFQELTNPVVRINTQDLTETEKINLYSVISQELAQEINWLTQAYAQKKIQKENIKNIIFREIIKESGKLNLSQREKIIRAYLESEEAEIELEKEKIETIIKLFPEDYNEKGIFKFLSEILPTEDSEDLKDLAASLSIKLKEALRKQRVEFLWNKIKNFLPNKAKNNENYRKRVMGLLWQGFTENPIISLKESIKIKIPEDNIIERLDFEVKQTGTPSFGRRFLFLLHHSQIQSLVMATIIVFLFTFLILRSLKGALISIISVLFPFLLTLGFMGYFRIPLDFGTVLTGGLIIGLGIDGAIHFMHRTRKEIKEGKDIAQAISLTVTQVGKAVVAANFTTMAGLGVLLTSSLKIIRNFAIVNLVALILVTLSVLTLIPTLIRILGFNHNLVNRKS
ncbi:MAG: RND family transporter [Candidatus Aminicenantia bacterium]